MPYRSQDEAERLKRLYAAFDAMEGAESGLVARDAFQRELLEGYGIRLTDPLVSEVDQIDSLVRSTDTKMATLSFII